MFYTFSQNNSGGFYKDPAPWVIIEADSPEEANNIAINVGLYFDGVCHGVDCDCCGDRWYHAYGDSDAYPEPMIYGSSIYAFDLSDPLDTYDTTEWYIGVSVMVVRKDSGVEWATIERAKKCLNQ